MTTFLSSGGAVYISMGCHQNTLCNVVKRCGTYDVHVPSLRYATFVIVIIQISIGSYLSFNLVPTHHVNRNCCYTIIK